MQPLFIGPYDIGMQKNLKPFMIPEKAFQNLVNAYVFRGRVEKKSGYSSLGRLRRDVISLSLGNISSPGAGLVTLDIPSILGEPHAQIVPGLLLNTITIGPPINQQLIDVGNGTMNVVGFGPITLATINYSTGIISIGFSGAAGASAVTLTGSYYPGLPIMGLRIQEESTLNLTETIAFDTKYAYHFVGGAWTELVPGITWTGTDFDFFWTTSYWSSGSNKLFWTTNFNISTPDPIRYYDGTTWVNFTPNLDSTGNVKLVTSLMLIPYKGRLVALNTYEQLTAGPSTYQHYPQRARWSQVGDPTDQTNAWRSDIVGRGGFIDAATNEQIVSAGFIKDILVVYFERSTWQLTYTGNPVIPFIWQRISQDLGAESTFSNVNFDNGLICFGNVGLHSCDSTNVQRMDEIIPDEVFSILNSNEGPQRVYAIRDFESELTYFTYPDPALSPLSSSDFKYPNKVLVYNYRNNTFSFFRENFTCYGYFQSSTTLTWADLIDDSGYSPWSSWLNPWNSGLLQNLLPSVCAGNQQGFVVLFDELSDSNSPTLTITALSGTTITSPNHNLEVGEFVLINSALGSTNLNGEVVQILSVTDTDNFVINATANPGYIGGGTMQLLSNIQILTKMFNPFWSYGRRYRLRQIEFLFDNTDDGEVTANIYTDMGDNYSVSDPLSNPSVLGSSTVLTSPPPALYGPGQISQEQIWSRMYYYTEGETFQIEITLSDVQMSDLNLTQTDVVLHGMVMHFEPAGEFL